jgi:uncharacterized membrane protein YGL010W
MKSLVEQLARYATYHRDRRNIATHFVGIPMIVVSLEALLARPAISVSGLPLSPAAVATLGAIAFYFALDRRYGLAMTAFFAGSLSLGVLVAAQPLGVWLGVTIGLFVVGWAFQFLGHFYEGRKPAFVDDLMGFLIGPLFVVAEAGFLFGVGYGVRREIERIAGPTRGRGDRDATAAR